MLTLLQLAAGATAANALHSSPSGDGDTAKINPSDTLVRMRVLTDGGTIADGMMMSFPPPPSLPASASFQPSPPPPSPSPPPLIADGGPGPAPTSPSQPPAIADGMVMGTPSPPPLLPQPPPSPSPPPQPLIPPFPVGPPTPPATPGAVMTKVHKTRVEMIAQGDVTDITESDKEAIRSAIASSANVEPSAVSVAVKPASVLIIVEITTPDAAAAVLVANALATSISTPEDATALLSAVSLVVTNTPTIEAVSETVLVPLAPAPSNDAGLIVVAVVVPVLLLVGGVALVAYYARSKRAAPPDGPAMQHAPPPLDEKELVPVVVHAQAIG